MGTSFSGFLIFLSKKESTDPFIRTLLLIFSLPFLIASFTMILLMLWYTLNVRRTNKACIKILLYDKLTEETERLFDALPALTFSENLSLRINK